MASDYQYDIALSFAGEDRAIVSPVASGLKSAGVNVFYDAFEVADLWGKDLYQHFSKIYFEESRFFVPFLSASYATKPWTQHELQNAQARAFQQNKLEYILPVRLDNTQISGILPTAAFVRFDDYKTDGLIGLILEKLDQSDRSPVNLRQSGSSRPSFGEVYIPKVKKSFSQRERDVFLKNSFSTIMAYFEEALTRLSESDADIETDFEPINRMKFGASVYVKGEVVNRCKVWTGGGIFRDSGIQYIAGKSIDFQRDDSMQESFSVGDDGHKLILDASMSHMFGQRGQTQDEESGTPEAAARDLWRRFVQTISHER